MKRLAPFALCATALATSPLAAEEPAKPEYPSPPEIVAKASAEEWVTIAPSDLLVMDLAPLGKGKKSKPRRVVIQLMPAPLGEDWVNNIRKLAASKFWDNTSINRVQENYVVQWGDATEKKPLPEGLAVVPESKYVVSNPNVRYVVDPKSGEKSIMVQAYEGEDNTAIAIASSRSRHAPFGWMQTDAYAPRVEFWDGWPLATEAISGDANIWWPVHCYAMVGVGRGFSPDTGSGAELYTVIGHAPRHLDRNIALVGRVIEGIENLSSLPRGTGSLGFYEKEEERVLILSIRLASELEPNADLKFEYLSTESASFAKYADARANRRDPFFIRPAGGADICNIPVPVRRKAP